LVHQIESGLYEREGKAISNFKRTLPAPDSDLAQATTKDPYNFDFLELTKEHNERELENALVDHVTKFLLELGSGFAYMGRQVPLKVGDSDFYLDLLFYHAKLHRYVVVELKTVKFVPEFAGKLNFYLSAVDDLIREDGDAPTVGILICKDKDKTVVEYALKDVDKPIGVSEYMITKSLPEEWQGTLPSIEEIDGEFEHEV
jgi:predicted nuclease of restriction endonuclease-like (RecB) superfamily